MDTNQQFNPFNGLAEDRSGIKFVAAGINYHQNKARRPKSRITEQLQRLPWRNTKEKLLCCITMPSHYFSPITKITVCMRLWNIYKLPMLQTSASGGFRKPKNCKNQENINKIGKHG